MWLPSSDVLYWSGCTCTALPVRFSSLVVVSSHNACTQLPLTPCE